MLVMGMHRSGTSAVARIVHLLGLRLGPEEDLYAAPDNPAGHFESSALIRENARLLAALGGHRTAGLPITPAVASSPEAAALMVGATRTFRRIYPEAGGWVWKDPRLCLTLPLWRTTPVVADAVSLLVFRHPVEVASSLAARDGRSIRYGLALWERYTRLSLQHPAGMPWVRVDHGDLLQDPVATTVDLAGRLERQGVAVTGDPSHAARSVDGALHRHRLPRVTPRLSAPQQALCEAVEALPPGGSSLTTPALPPETPSTVGLLRRRSPPWLWDRLQGSRPVVGRAQLT